MSLTTRLINATTATCTTQPISRNYPKNAVGFANTYTLFGLRIAIETTKERGYNRYETYLTLNGVQSYSDTKHPTGFVNWYNDYKSSLGLAKLFAVDYESIETHSPTKLRKAFENGVLVGESYVLTIINKYNELLFNDVEKEVITRQINELQSQLATIN